MVWLTMYHEAHWAMNREDQEFVGAPRRPMSLSEEKALEEVPADRRAFFASGGGFREVWVENSFAKGIGFPRTDECWADVTVQEFAHGIAISDFPVVCRNFAEPKSFGNSNAHHYA